MPFPLTEGILSKRNTNIPCYQTIPLHSDFPHICTFRINKFARNLKLSQQPSSKMNILAVGFVYSIFQIFNLKYLLFMREKHILLFAVFFFLLYEIPDVVFYKNMLYFVFKINFMEYSLYFVYFTFLNFTHVGARKPLLFYDLKMFKKIDKALKSSHKSIFSVGENTDF